MSLNNEEATAAFEDLSSHLREVGLLWVVHQIEEKIALGKVVARKLAAVDDSEALEAGWLDEDRPQKRGKRATFAVSEELSPQERLNVLIESVKVAVVDANEVAAASLSSLSQLGATGSAVFAPEAQVAERYILDRFDIEGRSDELRLLVALLNELGEENGRANATQSVG